MAVRIWARSVLRARVAAVSGTEGFLFGADTAIDGWEFQLIAHIRQDRADKIMRAKARQAFLDIALPCVEQCVDGAFELVPSAPQSDPQYCLVVVIPKSSTTRKTMLVVGAIARCKDIASAKQKLKIIAEWNVRT